LRWLGVELRHLAALKAVAEQRSFARAAQQLGYSQPAISQQISALERILRERLVERSPGSSKIALTPVGELVLRHAEAIVAQMHAAEADLSAHTSGTAQLRVGAYQSVGNHILPVLLRRFGGSYPEVRVELVETVASLQLLPPLQHGELDLAFVSLPFDGDEFAARELLRDPYVVAASPELELPSPLDPARLRELPHVGLRSRDPFADGFLREHGVEVDAVYRTDDNATLLGLVREGVGVALVTRLVLDPHDPGVAKVELRGEIRARVVGLAWHGARLLTLGAQAFADLAVHVCAELEAELETAWSFRDAAELRQVS
jgi:molybdate transport repressor ModE-like protein